jgi:hypothetical protein
MMRNKVAMSEELQRKVMARSEELRSSIGRIGDGATILGVKFIREVNISEGATIEGASHLENGTILRNATVGVDVRARDFIIDNDATVESGACIERCFVGEKSHLANGFTAADSLFFANCHCENGEAAAIFAGPFTVSHHKSSLLIAGIFSFFNAGSGTNQSNHLFKSGAVHQAVHLRGSKFGSNAYVMSPAIEGPYTVILGRHTRHHDTQDMPYSYLIEEDGHSSLVPAVALRSYGTVRDTEKWKSRDKRHLKRDNINFEEYNPYLTGKMLRGVDILTRLAEEDSEAKTYNYNRTVIKAPLLQRGIKLYNSAIAASIGMMLQAGDFSRASAESCGEWVDIAGQYIDKSVLDAILDSFTDINALNSALSDFNSQYENAARGWALAYMGKEPTAEDIAAAEAAQEALQRITDTDRTADTSPAMSVGYGIDSTEIDEILADFNAVQKK